jgi:hypothetical protein
MAASEAGVERVLLLSTLDLFRAYAEDMVVTEDWRPRPGCEPDTLGPHLAEFVAREFAHSHALRILILRLGHVVTAEEARELDYDPMWLDARDAVAAVDAVLRDEEWRPFRIVHLQHRGKRARFSGRRHHHRRHRHHRRRPPDYEPQFNFEEHA